MPSSFISEDQWALIAGILSTNPASCNLSRCNRCRLSGTVMNYLLRVTMVTMAYLNKLALS